ncbi:ACP S-malonyltransferase [Sporolactobacillus inulinus]|uniref:Malonyl CoA-acyl carrier protein transacylase n=1 Tax=Sporolactobacillus inulinus CASD TaxID=1069536 RepID=A0A0U1QM22_9BACL|nr:ACP S-malonyltransferase [Sporolactobacillus inulinus]KLI01855.1 malonyl CoA-ACP transacylase [Sporolactobacillus inulinus CASD]GEB75870.1 malonyl CoA-acyl carrier protein transacylase [Sporolactobacillus inulinus]
MSKIAFVFPGQGSQSVGMGADLLDVYPEAKSMFEAADKRLSFPLTELIMSGSDDQLKKTENTQPALLTVSAVLYTLLEKQGIKPDYLAGHSLGEYSALFAGGVLGFEDAVHAVRERGRLMEAAVPAGQGTMAAVLGLDANQLSTLCADVSKAGESVQTANINCPGQIVISGTVSGVEQASKRATEAGARRVVPLSVSGPFHSALMKPAAEKMRVVLDQLPVQNAKIAVIANSTAKEESEADEIRNHLIEQIYSPVRWTESVERLIELGVDTFVEVGPGKVLSGLIRKINRKATVIQVNDVQSLQNAVEQLKERVS